ncbi:MAG: phosphoribosyltransferase family protein [bacterium]
MSLFRTTFTGIKTLLRPFLDFLFPPVCLGCDEEIDEGLICDSCRLLLFTSEMDVCRQCGRPCLPEKGECGGCYPPLALSRVRAVGVYGPPFSGLIQALKYNEKTSLVPLLGAALALLIEQDSGLKQADMICPVPLHPARQRERGYNQATLLAAEAARITQIPFVDPLIRKKNTASQTNQVNNEERSKNVRGAFRVKDGERFDGMRLILVDDVMTTGATISSAAQELRAVGAAEVMGLVLAAAVGSKFEAGCRDRREKTEYRRASMRPPAVGSDAED